MDCFMYHLIRMRVKVSPASLKHCLSFGYYPPCFQRVTGRLWVDELSSRSGLVAILLNSLIIVLKKNVSLFFNKNVITSSFLFFSHISNIAILLSFFEAPNYHKDTWCHLDNLFTYWLTYSADHFWVWFWVTITVFFKKNTEINKTIISPYGIMWYITQPLADGVICGSLVYHSIPHIQSNCKGKSSILYKNDLLLTVAFLKQS